MIQRRKAACRSSSTYPLSSNGERWYVPDVIEMASITTVALLLKDFRICLQEAETTLVVTEGRRHAGLTIAKNRL